MEEEVLAELGLCAQCVTVKKKIVNCRGTAVVVDCQKEWLQRLLSEGNIPSQCYTHIRGRERPDRWHFSIGDSDSNKMPILIRIFPKRSDKVIPLPKSKVATGNVEPDLSFSRLLAYVSQMNHRNLWKESYKKRTVPYAAGSERQQSTVNVIEHNAVMNEVIFRLYGFNMIDLIKPDLENHGKSASEPLPHKSDTKLYEAPFNILPAVCAVEADKHIYTLHLFDYEYNLSDCIIFSPALLDRNYARCLFIIYQILQVMKSMYNRGLNFGEIHLKDIYLSDNLSIQILPDMMSNIHILNNDDIFEQPRVKNSPLFKNQSFNYLEHNSFKREKIVNLEKICHLWLKGSISNLDYLLHLNNLAGRKVGDPMAHPVVPWVTDFSSRCGKQWRDLTKSKYRLTKGDRQLDQTYEILGKELQANQSFPNQIPHHFSDVLSDITFYVYMARRTPKSVLCQYVRNNWVPAEYPSSIQRMQEWTPEECIPEFYTDPTVFRSAHEDLPDLEIPPWATCVEDFITKHREALESVQVSESLHHWIDLTFGYKLSGSAAIKAKNVCLSLVDGHSELTRSGPVQIFTNPHPARLSNTAQCWGEKLPPRIYWQKEKKKPPKVIESSDNSSDEEDVNIPQYYSTLTASTTHRHSISHSSRHKSHSRSRQHVKKEDEVKLNLSPGTSSNNTTEHRARSASATSSQFFKVQKSEWGKGPIYLPKEYNPTALLTAIENLHNFKLKTFYKSDTNIVQNIPIESKLMKCDFKSDTSFKNSDISNSFLSDVQSEENSFTNQMFVASYEQTIMKKQHKNEAKESFVKDNKKDRSYNVRQVTDASLFKQTVLANRKKDMQVLGCLIVEIFLHQKIRPFHDQITQNFNERYKVCRLVLKNNIQQLPKCVRYVCCLLLQVGESNMNIEDLSLKDFEDKLIENMNYDYRDVNFPCISKKGLPPPTSIQLLQPLLTNQLLPFPNHFPSLYLMTAVLHEYSLSEKEMNILYSFNCDGLECSKYQSIDKARIYFMQKIAEAKVHTCSKHLEELLTLAPSFNQFDSIDIFLLHFIELLNSKDTSILAAWYLFDPVAKALGPAESSNKLLNLVLNLYDDHEENNKRRKIDVKNLITTYNSRKSVKLYHNIFLLQLIVRFGLQCFLDNFIPHLVEAVGGYKDSNCNDVVLHSHSNTIQNKFSSSIKKLNYCEDNVKSSLHAPDIISPDTSCGSENTLTPSHENNGLSSTKSKKSPNDLAGENDVFHFENDTGKELTPSIASDDTKSWDSNSLNKASIKYLINEIDLVYESPSFGAYLSQTQGIEATESICSADEEPTSKDPNDIIFDDNNYGNSDDSPERNGTKSCTDTEKSVNVPTSPIIDIPNPHKTFTSYVQLAGGQLNFDTSNSELNNSSDQHISSKSLEMNKENNQKFTQSTEIKKCGRRSQQMYVECNNVKDYKISEMSYESLIWLAHRLGPVLTCKHITKNLLKMLTLCYIGTENLSFCKETKLMNGLDSLCIVNGRLSGDSNAYKVIECLTSIAALYGEQIILLQYFPHMGDLIASCRRRISPPLEGGLIACMQLLRFLIPYISDVKLMEQLQDIILKNILHPTVRLITSTRSTFPNGNIARTALAKKFLETLFIIATRIGVEMTRKHLCVPAMQRFFLAFDKVNENNECLKTNKSFHSNDQLVANLDGKNSSVDESGSYLEICRDGSTTEWRIKGGEICSTEADTTRDSSASPPDKTDIHTASALEELQAVFSPELAYESYIPFVKFVGEEIMQRSLKNFASLQKLCNEFKSAENDDITDGVNKINIEKSESISLNNSQPNAIEQMYSNSFGSNIVKIGNRIDILSEPEPVNVKVDGININDAFDIVSCKMESGMRSSRHLRGDWLMYWEHEIGRPEKDNRFNLKQIKLQMFNGHTHSIKNIVCLDNENSFMTASKDKTVKLWSLRNQGDGSAISSCQWTYAAHKKGVLSLTFLESLRLAVSTDANVHIWDPYVESVVAQLDNSKNAPISIVKAMPAPSSLVLAATTDTILKVIDTRTCSFIHDLKVSFNPNTFIRCICVSPSGRWIALGLATGHLSLIDPRTGVLLAHWKAHDGEILQLVTVNESSIVSSSLDQTMLVWSTLDGKLKFQLKGSTEPVHCLSTYYNELISGTTNNRIGVHTAVDQDASFSSTKLRSDTFKGVLTSMTVLPLNRLLLLGGESGNVILLC